MTISTNKVGTYYIYKISQQGIQMDEAHNPTYDVIYKNTDCR